MKLREPKIIKNITKVSEIEVLACIPSKEDVLAQNLIKVI